MNEQAAGSLRHWWWPGQWLRIVHGVWLSQTWYWYTVRPALSRGSRRRRWGVFLQGVLGMILTAMGLAAAAGGVLGGVGIPVDWLRLASGVVGGALSGLIAGIACGPVGLGGVVALGVPWGLVGGVTSGVNLGAVELYGGCLVWGLAIGLALAAADGAMTGVIGELAWRDSLRVAVGTFVLIAAIVTLRFHTMGSTMGASPLSVGRAAATGVTVSTLATGAGLAGLHIGWRWVARRIPDAETRRRLLSPDGEQ